MSSATTEFTLIDQLLADQAKLQTPVAEFSSKHHREPDLTENFKSLIPLTKPGPGEQYAFQVELDKCTGCKACVSACHSLNGLDEGESWRDVGTVIGGESDPTYSQTVTTACHHCESPECLHGCPVGAYDKDSETGIVRHLDDQCIGCSYCVLKCPYDVPKYSEKRGIVRKCDMCHDRLAEGEAPACVQACPTEAIKIITVRQSSPAPAQKSFFRIRLLPSISGPGSSRYLPRVEPPSHQEDPSPSRIFPSGAFHLTTPTTQYIGRSVPETIYPADRASLRPEHAHAPLIGMLTLTQMGCGLLLLPLMLQNAFLPALVGTVLVFAGLGIGALHLGQPLKVWRFFLGLRTSWLSREFLLFGALTAIAPLLVLLTAPITPDFTGKGIATVIAAALTALTALTAVFTSVMLYVDTGRRLWSLPRTSVRFFGTTLATTFLGAAWIIHPLIGLFASFILAGKLANELRLFFLRRSPSTWTPDHQTSRLQRGPLKRLSYARFATAAGAIVLAPFTPLPAIGLLLASELLERTLFFQSVHAPKMPGPVSN